MLHLTAGLLLFCSADVETVIFLRLRQREPSAAGGAIGGGVRGTGLAVLNGADRPLLAGPRGVPRQQKTVSALRAACAGLVTGAAVGHFAGGCAGVVLPEGEALLALEAAVLVATRAGLAAGKRALRVRRCLIL